MPSTFFGLDIAASGLSAFQTSLNTTANNISNVKTTGYTRQTAELQSTDPIRVYTKYGSVGTGVEVTQITQERNLYYDRKYWENNQSKGYFEQKLYYLDQIEEGFKDDSTQEGFTTIFAKMFASLDTLKTKGEDVNVRNQFIHQAQSLCTYFNTVSQSLKDVQDDANEEIKSCIDSVNSMAQKISVLNKEINMIEVRGGHANELRDQRANLIDELSELVSVETQEFAVHNSHGQDLGGTNYRVIINGQVLVDGNEFRTLECQTTDDYKNNINDVDGLYAIVWADTKMDFAATGGSAGGKLKSLFAVRDGNASDNLKGKVVEPGGVDLAANTITITGLSTSDLHAINIPEKGNLTLGNRHMTFEGWTAEINEKGVQSITFQMTGQLPDTVKGSEGKLLECGVTVDEMGVPYYQSQINEFIRNFTMAFNDIEKTGVDLNGEPMGSFFVGITGNGTVWDMDDYDAKKAIGPNYSLSSTDDSYWKITASNIAVNKQSFVDANYFSTSEKIVDGVAEYKVAEKLLTLQKGVKMFRGDNAESFLETLLSDITVDTDKTKINKNNYANLVVAIEKQRTSVSGVDQDEEALNLVKFQNAYNLASKVISVMAEVYNKLINETGV